MVHWRLLPSALAALPFTDWSRMADALEAQKRESTTESRRDAAFTAWLLGAGGQKTWSGFCEHFGLMEKQPKMTNEERRAMIEKAYAIAERAANM
jgi:hypothetical protein